jgi:hypothetical protein
MSDLDGLIDLIPIGDIAKKLGIDPDVAESAVKVALPVIVSGLAANAKDKAGEKSLESALSNHEPAKGKVDIDDIDTEDGEKILGHVFGSKKDDVVKAVAKKSDNATQEIIAQILPIIAPIVLSWLASQFLNQKKAAPAAKKEAAPAAKEESTPASGLGDILGSFLSSSQGQEIIGGVIGGLLGSGTKK